MALNLPPIPGEDPKTNPDSTETDEDFDFEAIPFKADYMYTNIEDIKEELKKGSKILGSPAASLTWGIDGNRAIPAISAGIEGENQTANTLREIVTKTKGMFLFHSLSWPESAGDTDHVLVYGENLLIIDSKRWKGSRKYSITDKGEIKRGTVPFPEGKVKIGYALKVWRKKFPNSKVLGVVSIAQEKIFVVRDKNWYKAPYRLVENEKLIEFIEEMIEGIPAKPVPAKLLIDLGKLLVKPRDRAAEFIKVGADVRQPEDY